MTAKRGDWPPSGFGERLKALREAAALSQQELANRADCSLFTISKLERGVQEPAWPLVLALARALDVNVLEFVPPPTLTESPPKKPRKAPPA